MNKEGIFKELQFKAVRSSGAGGQHVNKVSSKVELSFDLVNSANGAVGPGIGSKAINRLGWYSDRLVRKKPLERNLKTVRSICR